MFNNQLSRNTTIISIAAVQQSVIRSLSLSTNPPISNRRPAGQRTIKQGLNSSLIFRGNIHHDKADHLSNSCYRKSTGPQQQFRFVHHLSTLSISASATTNRGVSFDAAGGGGNSNNRLQNRYRRHDERLDRRISASVTLAKMQDAGFDLFHISVKARHLDFYSQLDWELDIEPRMNWLHDIGKSETDVVKILSKSPRLFRKSIEDVEGDLKLIGKLIGVEKEFMYDYLQFAESILLYPTADAEGVQKYMTDVLGLNQKEIQKAFMNFYMVFNSDPAVFERVRKEAQFRLKATDEHIRTMFIARPATFRQIKNIEAMEELLNRGLYTVDQLAASPIAFRSVRAATINAAKVDDFSFMRRRIQMVKKMGKSELLANEGEKNYIAPSKLVDIPPVFQDCVGLSSEKYDEMWDSLKQEEKEWDSQAEQQH